MSIQKVIEEHYGNAWDVGDVLICLSDAVATNDPERARHAMMRCGDVARRLERRQRKDPAHQPAPESEVETPCGPKRGYRIRSRIGETDVELYSCPSDKAWTEQEAQEAANVENTRGGNCEHWVVIPPETVVCQDWHGAVREMRTGTPNSAMSAVIAPTPSTPGWLDKAAEALAEKRIDSDEEVYQWGGGRWCVMDGKTWCWNARECEWNESTMTPEQLRQDGTRTN